MAEGSMQARMAALGVAVGVPFGWALHKAGVLEPRAIKEQLRLRDWTMMKTFLSALTTGLASVTVLHSLEVVEACARPLYPIATISGGVLIGVGMHLSGACPGTLLGQLPMKRNGVLYVLAGAVTGALAFGYAQPYLLQHTNIYFSGSASTLFEHLNVEMWHVALPALVILGTALYALESFAPMPLSKSSDTSSSPIVSFLRRSRWHPYISGVILGLLQIPALLIGSVSIGTSTAYVSVVAHVRSFVHNVPNEYFARHLLTSAKMCFKLALDYGIALGALLSIKSSVAQPSGEEKRERRKKRHSPWGRYRSIVRAVRLCGGGFCLLFGSRLADGCTSGHGLTGLANLGLSSLIATGVMFGTGILFARYFHTARDDVEEEP